MIIRRETQDDFDVIYDLVKVAFETAKVSNGKEQDYVNYLRKSGKYIPELALVAEDDGKLIGHIMLTRIDIVSDEGRNEGLLLAPISVELAHRNKGVGSALIRESFKRAHEMNFTSVLLVGDPAYYNRFGFRQSIDFGIKYATPIPDEYVLACELIPDALEGIHGVFSCETEASE
jgi:putative acetyltransferase